MNIFDLMYEDYKLDTTKPIRLFEAFSGYGSQQMALKRLGVKVEVIGYSEIDKYAIEVYEKLHGKHKNYGGIGSFDRLPKDIDICTWSFPCQDISLAGKQRGMESGSRSNYGYVFLDTVEATPYHERPKVLLMENVRALFSAKFRDDWREIQVRLERLGYTNHADILNAKDYGVAQNRERVFIVSILGEYNYNFPKPIQLTKRLKDYLEDEVDEKYYLSDKTIENTFLNYKGNTKKNGFKRDKIFINNVNRKDISQTITTKMDRAESQYVTEHFDYIMIKTNNEENLVYKTREYDMPRHRLYDIDSVGFTITTNSSQQPSIIIPEATKQGYALAQDGDGIYINRPHQKRGVVQKGMIQTIKTNADDIGVVTDNPLLRRNVSIKEVIKTFDNGHQLVVLDNGIGAINTELGLIFIRKLTPREVLRLMDVSEDDIDIILNTVSNAQAYKLAGNSIVVNVLVEIFRKLLKEE